MAKIKVNYYQGVVTGDRVTILVPPEDFEPHSLLDVYPAECFKADNALIVKFKMPQEKIFATDLKFLDTILSGEKEIWITHLNAKFGYVLNQCRLDFS
ncbi:hypothetical protein [Pseudosulfitobacter pseudonitzschiae]|uniref:hypothetical protein n=1 Tax=Pseudosulfitobacter pseudonitzschiae TaxID=1402135 RepID=UPI003B82BC04